MSASDREWLVRKRGKWTSLAPHLGLSLPLSFPPSSPASPATFSSSALASVALPPLFFIMGFHERLWGNGSLLQTAIIKMGEKMQELLSSSLSYCLLAMFFTWNTFLPNLFTDILSSGLRPCSGTAATSWRPSKNSHPGEGQDVNPYLPGFPPVPCWSVCLSVCTSSLPCISISCYCSVSSFFPSQLWPTLKSFNSSYKNWDFQFLWKIGSHSHMTTWQHYLRTEGRLSPLDRHILSCSLSPHHFLSFPRDCQFSI